MHPDPPLLIGAGLVQQGVVRQPGHGTVGGGLERPGHRAGEAVCPPGRPEERRRAEIRHRHPVDRVGRGDILARGRDIDQILHDSLPGHA